MTQILPSGTLVSTKTYPGSISLGGTFKVSYQNKTSAPQSIGVSYRKLERDLNLLFTELNSNLVLKGESNADHIQLFFMLPYYIYNNNSKMFSVDCSLLTGGGIYNSLTPNSILMESNVVQQPGQTAYFPVIPSDFFRTFETTPQVIVEIGGVRAVCKGNCSFVYKKYPDYPQISSMTANSTDLVIFGGEFINDYNITIEIGYANCPIT